MLYNRPIRVHLVYWNGLMFVNGLSLLCCCNNLLTIWGQQIPEAATGNDQCSSEDGSTKAVLFSFIVSTLSMWKRLNGPYRLWRLLGSLWLQPCVSDQKVIWMESAPGNAVSDLSKPVCTVQKEPNTACYWEQLNQTLCTSRWKMIKWQILWAFWLKEVFGPVA